MVALTSSFHFGVKPVCSDNYPHLLRMSAYCSSSPEGLIACASIGVIIEFSYLVSLHRDRSIAYVYDMILK